MPPLRLLRHVKSDAPQATHDDVNAAFNSGSVLTEPDDRLLDYLRVLCTTQIRSDENRLLANNRAITINAVLMRRYLERENRTTTRLTWFVIFLAALGLVGVAVQIWVAVN